MTLRLLFEVVEHFEDDAPEHWGQELLDHIPTVGEVIRLHWLTDGTKRPTGEPAHKLKVTSVDDAEGGPTIHGVRTP